MNSRVIREHRVFGTMVCVRAQNADEARAKAMIEGRGRFDHAWDANEYAPGEWEVYLAKHEDAFAEND